MEVNIGGQSLHVQNVNINSKVIGFVTEQPANSLLLRTRNETEFRVYEKDDNTGAFYTVLAGQALSLNVATLENKPILWIRTTAGTDVLEVISLH